ncbi:hypothetical protein DENIS_2005 [Desulfonema ishimotonii]|uniref:Haloacid dehalogenase-like hydrolase n=1 Tax=Desulfonema ishimotonii TaxID=45657 RepID=A0A401FVQ9_9BACT|nr:HAD family hydrolase [Desulfonema ishimotonii]GBC61045.1 hypothetical protein DENIS_2005 [Desulfonema ishimotonii]
MSDLIPRTTQPAERIVLDFDGTLIREHILTSWVRFILFRSDMPSRRKFLFFFSSLWRGIASVLLSPHPARAEQAVRIAFKAFSGVEKQTLSDLVHHRSGKKQAYAISLNTELLPLLSAIRENMPPETGIQICSQGSSADAIREFLNRPDVASRLKGAGISADTIPVLANEMETDRAGHFTGKLKGHVVTKFNRLEQIRNHPIFIGDDKDEAALRKSGIRTEAFINWKKEAAPRRM